MAGTNGTYFPTATMNEINFSAKWIWKKRDDYKEYNQKIIARKIFTVADLKDARIAITADSWYRLYVNGQWVNDGPCRSWPQSYQYDEFEISSYLHEGQNEILVRARYFGAGHFHRIPIQAGLLAQVELVNNSGKKTIIATDKSWDVADAAGWDQHTPKVGLGMEPFEKFDARLSQPDYEPAEELFAANKGPWKNLHPRDVALMTYRPFELKGFKWAKTVNADWFGTTFSVVRTIHPNLIEGDGFTSMAAAISTIILCDEDQDVHIESYPPDEGPTIAINGDHGNDGVYHLKKGRNFLLGLFQHWGYHNKEQGLRFLEGHKLKYENPSDPSDENAWDFIRIPELVYHEMDGELRGFNPPDRIAWIERVNETYERIRKEVIDEESYSTFLSHMAMHHNIDATPVDNPHWQFECRQVIDEDVSNLIDLPEALMTDNPDWTVINPDDRGDLELCYDLGEQNVGYYEFEIEAEEGTVIDLYSIEHICRKNGIQHTWGNRNGLRYICGKGVNRYLSHKRRSGRYFFLMIRNQQSPVRIRNLRLIESTYPVNRIGHFNSSDMTLNHIWRISERTLKLCMEDVFTDCPLYEQTLWVGDARNEGLFSMTTYGQTDIIRRCIKLAAEGLDLFPIIPSHVPTSCGFPMLPAWSFLWGISVWDYYYYSGDVEFLKWIWPRVLENLKGIESYKDERGLFSAAFWNMFDWIGIDAGHKSVTHNSMLLVGCLKAGIDCAKILDDQQTIQWLESWNQELVTAINKLWNEDKQSYVDSVHDDGELSAQTCVHTNFLSLLYDIVEEDHYKQAIENVINPPEGMTTFGSPFATQYLNEALEKIGCFDEIIDMIYQNYLPMVREGATTVWEQFACGHAFNPNGYPTRSHAHAWSSAPIHFLNRIVLGIKQTDVACKGYEISPRVNRWKWADGATASIHGAIECSWEKVGDKLVIKAKAPEGVSLNYVYNETHKDFTVEFNGVDVTDARKSDPAVVRTG